MVLSAYNSALVTAFYVGLGLSCASIIGALTIEWKNIKKDKPKPKVAKGSEKDVEKAERKTSTDEAEAAKETAETKALDESLSKEAGSV